MIKIMEICKHFLKTRSSTALGRVISSAPRAPIQSDNTDRVPLNLLDVQMLASFASLTCIFDMERRKLAATLRQLTQTGDAYRLRRLALDGRSHTLKVRHTAPTQMQSNLYLLCYLFSSWMLNLYSDTSLYWLEWLRLNLWRSFGKMVDFLLSMGFGMHSFM